MQLGGGAVEDPLTVGEHQQPVAVALGLEQVVGRVDHRGPGAGEAEDELPEALALARVEPGRGLVEQQHRGRREQADGDVDPLLVAARERRDLVVATLSEPGLARASARLRPRRRRPARAERTDASSRPPSAAGRAPPIAGPSRPRPGPRPRPRRACGSLPGSRAGSSCRRRWARSPPAARPGGRQTRPRAGPRDRRSSCRGHAPRSPALRSRPARRPVVPARSPAERYATASSVGAG